MKKVNSNLKNFLINLLGFIGPLAVLVSTIITLLSQNLDLHFDSYDKDMMLYKNVSAAISFFLVLMLYCFLEEVPKRCAWLCFCLGMSLLLIGMYFHVSVWIMLAAVIVMVVLISHFCGGEMDFWGRWVVTLAGVSFVFIICSLLSLMFEGLAERRQAYREYCKNPDSYPKTVIRDIRESEMYTDEYGIIPFSASDENGLDDIQKGDTVRLWVVKDKVKAVFYNSRTENKK